MDEKSEAMSEVSVKDYSEEFMDKKNGKAYACTKVILRGPGEEDLFWACVKAARGWDPYIRPGDIPSHRIPFNMVYPLFPTDGSLTQAPDPLPPNTFVKEPKLLSYNNKTDPREFADHILREATVCEALRKNPHSNIAEYRGCIVKAGRIVGLCFERYVNTLEKRLAQERTAAYRKAVASGAIPAPAKKPKSSWWFFGPRYPDIDDDEYATISAEEEALEGCAPPPLDRVQCYEDIEAAIKHLHSMGLIHGELNPSNIMLDAEDKAVLIDFDCARAIGDDLGPKGYVPGWSLEGVKVAKTTNDSYSLIRVRDHLGGTYAC